MGPVIPQRMFSLAQGLGFSVIWERLVFPTEHAMPVLGMLLKALQSFTTLSDSAW